MSRRSCNSKTKVSVFILAPSFSVSKQNFKKNIRPKLSYRGQLISTQAETQHLTKRGAFAPGVPDLTFFPH